MQTLDRAGARALYCRLPHVAGGTLGDADVCPGSMRVSPLYIQAGSDLESVAGVLMQYRTKWGYLISTVRLDCPYMVALEAPTPAQTRHRRRRMQQQQAGSRSTRSNDDDANRLAWPGGTWLNSSVLAGQVHMQHAMRAGYNAPDTDGGGPGDVLGDPANFLSLSATLLNGQSAFPSSAVGIHVERMVAYRVSGPASIHTCKCT